MGILSVVPTIRATEPPKVDANRDAIGDPFAPDSRVSLSLPLQGSEDLTYGAVTESSAGEPDASELNRELTNPVSSIWSISNQFNNFELNNGQWNNNWNFQPVHASEPDQRLEPDHAAGDALLQHRPARDVTPTNSRGTPGWAIWLWWSCCRLRTRATGFSEPGLPPSSRLRPRCSRARANGSLGPLSVVGYLTKQYFIGVFPQQWWSIGGEHFRHDTNQMNLQPIASIFFGEGWSLGYSGNILADWNAPSEDVWTVPVGLGLGKVVKFGRLPVKIQLAVQYMPVHPRISGQEWNVQVSITPVLPKLIKGVLFQ